MRSSTIMPFCMSSDQNVPQSNRRAEATIKASKNEKP